MEILAFIVTFLTLFENSNFSVNCAYRSDDGAALQTLWNLTKFALESKRPNSTSLYQDTNSRQMQQHHQQQHFGNYYHKYQPNYGFHSSYYHPQRPFGVPPSSNYGNYGLTRPHIVAGGYPQQRPVGGLFNSQLLQNTLSLLPSRESFMDALDSIARNDELHCVPRILCEVTSGTLSARQDSFKLPFNINMDSIIGLLANFNGIETNPILSFGKAALLGYSSKGNADTCVYAYPTCPRDPERLVEYLNNYNGGFFRFFNGLNQQQQHFQHNQIPPQYYGQNYPSRPSGSYGFYNPYNGYGYKANKLEKRILTKPTEFDYSSNRYLNNGQQKGIKFPIDIELYNAPSNNFLGHYSDSLRTLKFPIREENTYDGPLRRRPKQHPVFNFQKPSSNHIPTPMIFPDRTGTGELKFTLEELSNNYRRPFALQNNNLISFDLEPNNDPLYYINSGSNSLGADTYEFNRQNNRFFPS